MGQTVRLTDIPEDQVAEVKQTHEDAGATVTVTKQPDGRYTVVAVYP